MTRLLVATTNPHKLREIRGLLADAPVELVGLDALPRIEEPQETGNTFDANARLKALYYDAASSGFSRTVRKPAPVASDFSRKIEPVASGFSRKIEPVASGVSGKIDLTVAEDSGLVIDALDGEPGVRSARFLSADATYPERFAEILRRLDQRSDRPRTARFICALAVVHDGGVVYETRGTVEGEIAREPRGTAGFGYDPIFYYPMYGCTLAEVTEDAKLRVAHRGRAFRSLARWLKERRTENRF